MNPERGFVIFEAADRAMHRLPPLTGWRYWLAAVGFFAVFFLPVLALASWVVWTEIRENLRKPEGC